MKNPRPRPKFDNPYEAQRVMYWTRKMQTLTPDELEALIIQQRPEEIILEKARAEAGKKREEGGELEEI